MRPNGPRYWTAVLCAAMLGLVGCSPGADSSQSLPSASSGSQVSDGTTSGGTPGFYFLPPIAPTTTYGAESVSGLSPTIAVEELGGRGVIATFSTNAKREDFRIREKRGKYVAEWELRHSGVRLGSIYRIHVYLGEIELGFADCTTARTKAEVRDARNRQLVPLQGDELKIAFRIEPLAADTRKGGSGHVLPAGGTITTDLADIIAPPDTSVVPLDLTVTRVVTPSGLPEGVVAVGPATNITLGPGQVEHLRGPLVVTLKYLASPNNNPSKFHVFHYDGALSRYEPATVIAEDVAAQTITILAAHFSAFQIVDYSKYVMRPSTSTGFSAADNGWYLGNYNSPLTPAGACYGMASYAAWYFDRRSTPPLYGKYTDNLVEFLLYTRAHIEQNQAVAYSRLLAYFNLPDSRVADLMMINLTNSSRPLILHLIGAGQHAGVMYGYSDPGNISPKEFYFYDPNYPTKQQTLYLRKGAGVSDPWGWAPYEGYAKFLYIQLQDIASGLSGFEGLTNEADAKFQQSPSIIVDPAYAAGAQVHSSVLDVAGVVQGLNGGATLWAYAGDYGPLPWMPSIALDGGMFSARLNLEVGWNRVAFLAGTEVNLISPGFPSASQIINIDYVSCNAQSCPPPATCQPDGSCKVAECVPACSDLEICQTDGTCLSASPVVFSGPINYHTVISGSVAATGGCDWDTTLALDATGTLTESQGLVSGTLVVDGNIYTTAVCPHPRTEPLHIEVPISGANGLISGFVDCNAGQCGEVIAHRYQIDAGLIQSGRTLSFTLSLQDRIGLIGRVQGYSLSTPVTLSRAP